MKTLTRAFVIAIWIMAISYAAHAQTTEGSTVTVIRASAVKQMVHRVCSCAQPSSGQTVSLAAARALPINKGKSDADITADIKAHGHKVGQ
jgi:hypothetical protein